MNAEVTKAGGKRVAPGHAQRLVARAMALAEADKAGAGLNLLRRQRKDLKFVPPAYDAAIGSLALLAGRAAVAVDFLTRAECAHGTLPNEARRNLADALLGCGRIEEAGRQLRMLRDAGGKTTRPAHVTAIKAFDNMIGDIPDAGSPTPWRILAHAEVLADAKQRIEAPKLLAAHRGEWEDVPPSYDTALCQLAARCGDKTAAVACLTQACNNCRGPVPVILRQALGIALFSIGQVSDGAEQLSIAVEQGAEINRTDLRIAVAAYRSTTGDAEPVDTRFPRSLTLVDHVTKLVYLSLPKNACSMLKATFVMNTSHREAYLAGGHAIHAFCDSLTTAPLDRDVIMGADYFRFVVLREPLRRVLSAYLDKFVRRRNARDRGFRIQQMQNTIRAAQKIAGLDFDPKRSISFEEFVRFLATAEDTELNMHWMPQSRSVGTDLSIYNHVGKIERLSETLDLLERKFGFVHESLGRRHMPVARRHITKFSETADLKHPFRALPAELDAYESGLPMPELFFTPELTEILQHRYAADVTLYKQA